MHIHMHYVHIHTIYKCYAALDVYVFKSYTLCTLSNMCVIKIHYACIEGIYIDNRPWKSRDLQSTSL